MIPLKDDIPRLSTPLVNALLILLNVVVFLFQNSLDRASQNDFIRTFGLVPARLAAILPGAVAHAMRMPMDMSVSGVCSAADTDQHVHARQLVALDL